MSLCPKKKHKRSYQDKNVIEQEKRRAGRFVLATNVLDIQQLSLDEMLEEYKAQQSAERGFGFLKDPLFFTDSVFLKSPERVEAMAMLMGLCLLIYTLGQRQMRQALQQAHSGIKNQRQQVDGTSDVTLDISRFPSRTFTNCQRREANL